MSVDVKSEGLKQLNQDEQTPTLIEDKEHETQDFIMIADNPRRIDSNTGSFISNDMPIGVSNLDKKWSP